MALFLCLDSRDLETLPGKGAKENKLSYRSWCSAELLTASCETAVLDKVWTFLLHRHQMWRQPKGVVGQKCSLHMKICKTETQILAANQDGQKGKAQAGTQEWGFLFPVKPKEFTTDFPGVFPQAGKQLKQDNACTNEKASPQVEVVHSHFSLCMWIVLVTYLTTCNLTITSVLDLCSHPISTLQFKLTAFP